MQEEITTERTRFIRFAVVGTIGALVDFGVFNLLIQLFDVRPVWANVISFSVAVVSNFVWNRYWTYPESRSKSIQGQMAQFFVVNLIGLFIRTPMFAWLEPKYVSLSNQLFAWLPVAPDFIGHNAALGTSMILVLFWNFFINRYWTYADVPRNVGDFVSEKP